MIKSLNVTPGSPFFANDGNKIFVMFDPPQLIKNNRNNFRKHGFLWDEEWTRWSYVQDFYEFDKSNPVKMAPKLTPKHVYLLTSIYCYESEICHSDHEPHCSSCNFNSLQGRIQCLEKGGVQGNV